MQRISVQEPYRHFLLHIAALQCVAEIVERDFALAALIRLHDGALGNADQLVLANVGADHHVQNVEQLIARNRFVIVQIVHLESDCVCVYLCVGRRGIHQPHEWQICRRQIRTLELLLAIVEPIGFGLLDGPEVGQHLHELAKVDAIVVAVGKERVHNAIDQRIDGQLRDAQKVLARQCAAIAAVQRREARIQALDLAGRDCVRE